MAYTNKFQPPCQALLNLQESPFCFLFGYLRENMSFWIQLISFNIIFLAPSICLKNVRFCPSLWAGNISYIWHIIFIQLSTGILNGFCILDIVNDATITMGIQASVCVLMLYPLDMFLPVGFWTITRSFWGSFMLLIIMAVLTYIPINSDWNFYCPHIISETFIIIML